MLVTFSKYDLYLHLYVRLSPLYTKRHFRKLNSLGIHIQIHSRHLKILINLQIKKPLWVIALISMLSSATNRKYNK